MKRAINRVVWTPVHVLGLLMNSVPAAMIPEELRKGDEQQLPLGSQMPSLVQGFSTVDILDWVINSLSWGPVPDTVGCLHPPAANTTSPSPWNNQKALRHAKYSLAEGQRAFVENHWYISAWQSAEQAHNTIVLFHMLGPIQDKRIIIAALFPTKYCAKTHRGD